MSPERWQRIDRLFHSALKRAGAERAAFLARECGGDEELRAEVESLVASHEEAGGFIETPASDVAAEMFSADEIRLEAGRQIGRYTVVELLGAGGMGEVYLAEDEQLGRRVAVKVLGRQLGRRESDLRRFEHEAKAASALNHPNILVIHEIGEADGAHYIVSEYVEGETLREIVAGSPMPLPDVLEIAVQIASALSAAHRAGLVHRDIKPENIVVRPDGYVKILDFGLAKLVGPSGAPHEAGPHMLSGDGLILGTPDYMSPEQARGEKVDARSDVFSFGAVLYEMLTGRAPFAGASPAETAGNLMAAEPRPLAEFAAGLPDEMQAVVSRALRKKRDERYRTMGEMLADLKGLKEGLAFAEARRGGSRRLRWAAALAALASVAVLAGFAVWKSRQARPDSVRFLRPTQITTWTSLDIYPAFSPDGNAVAYTSDHGGSFEIYVKPLAPGAGETRLTSDGQQNFQPAFSPDGRFVAYYSKNRGGIWVIPSTGGAARRLTPFGSRPAWSPDGRLIAFQSNPITDLGAGATPATAPSTIWTVPAEGGEPAQLTRRGEPAGGHGSPAWSPDGARVVFCVSDFVEGSVWTVSSAGGDLRQVAKGYLVDAVYAPDGESIYYGSEYGLWRIRVARATGEPIGEPVELANTSPARLRHFAVSADGKRIAYTPLSIASNILSVPVAPATYEAAGEPVSLTQNRRFRNTFPSFSPDGKRIAYQSFNVGGESDIWLMDSDGRNAAQVTTEGGFCPSWFPGGTQILFSSDRQERWKAWATDLSTRQDRLLLDPGEDDVQYLQLSPDGTQIVFNSKKSGTTNVAVIPAAGGEARQLTFDKELAGFACWSPDGRFLAFEIKRGDDTHLAVMPSGGGEVTQLTFDRGQSWAHSFAPDGDRIAFAGFRDGLWNIYWVSRSTGRQQRLTNYTKLNAYVRYPSWSPLGNQIAYEYAETTGNIWIADLR